MDSENIFLILLPDEEDYDSDDDRYYLPMDPWDYDDYDPDEYYGYHEAEYVDGAEAG